MARLEKRTILIAGIGTSPAVLTETVWVLAHQKEAVVPEEVVVVTTKTGKARLWTELVDGGVWKDLVASLARERIPGAERLHLGTTAIRVLPDAEGNEIDDLRTAEDNLRAADFMLGVVRQYTADPSTRVLASIAGGRKTMSALLFSCMSLLGREDDKVYHVLIPVECEGGMKPPFYYPARGVRHQILLRGQPAGKSVVSTKIPVELFEVPFVRMRGWYQEKFKTIPPSFRTLIARFQSVAPLACVYPSMEIDLTAGTLRLDGHAVPLSKAEFTVLVLLSRGCPMGALLERLVELHGAKSGKQMGWKQMEWLEAFRNGSRFAKLFEDDLSKTLSDLRKKLESAGFVDVDALVPRRRHAVAFPLDRIVWRNESDFLDVCGCPNIFA